MRRASGLVVLIVSAACTPGGKSSSASSAAATATASAKAASASGGIAADCEAFLAKYASCYPSMSSQIADLRKQYAAAGDSPSVADGCKQSMASLVCSPGAAAKPPALPTPPAVPTAVPTPASDGSPGLASSYDPTGVWTITKAVTVRGEHWHGRANITKQTGGPQPMYTVDFRTDAFEGSFSARGMGGDLSDGFNLVLALPGQELPKGTRLGTNLYKIAPNGDLSGWVVSTAWTQAGTESCTGGGSSLAGSWACKGVNASGGAFTEKMVTKISDNRIDVTDPDNNFVGVGLRIGDWVGQAQGPTGGVVFNITRLHFEGDKANGEYAPINHPGKGTIEMKRGWNPTNPVRPAPSPRPVPTPAAASGACAACPYGSAIVGGCSYGADDELTKECPSNYSCLLLGGSLGCACDFTCDTHSGGCQTNADCGLGYACVGGGCRFSEAPPAAKGKVPFAGACTHSSECADTICCANGRGVSQGSCVGGSACDDDHPELE
jgi:hypothetical protein